MDCHHCQKGRGAGVRVVGYPHFKAGGTGGIVKRWTMALLDEDGKAVKYVYGPVTYRLAVATGRGLVGANHGASFDPQKDLLEPIG